MLNMALEELKQLMESGQFHHATYRNLNTLWEGLWIYRKYDGLRGFEPVGCFGKEDANLKAAEDMVRHTGISFGSYGKG